MNNNSTNKSFVDNTKETVEIFFSCRKLINMDLVTKTDPFIKFYRINEQNVKIKIGETEKIDDNLNPDFDKTFVVPFIFEKKQFFYCEVYDYDSDGSETIIGGSKFLLADLICSEEGFIEKEINGSKKNLGQLIIRAEKVANRKDIIQFDIYAENIKKQNCFFSPKPFLMIYKSIVSDYLNNYNQNNDKNIKSKNIACVYKSEIKKGKNVFLGKVNTNLSKLSSGKLETPLEFKLFNYHRFSGKHSLIGKEIISIENILSGLNDENEMIIPLKDSKNNCTGRIIIKNFKMIENYDFIDYLQAGLNIALKIGIDYTASNRDPDDKKSLHHFSNSNIMNPYKSAINKVGDILMDYDDDKLVPCYGFGAVINNNCIVNHCFNINFTDDPNIYLLNNILKTYDECTKKIKFSGPTYFGPLLETLISDTEKELNEADYSYSFYLIITDGIIHDMSKTKDLIIKASSLPISIVIIGVGDEDFNKMKELDDCLFKNLAGESVERDIVKFVDFKEVKNDITRLTEEVLQEIPDQISKYYGLRKIKPDDIKNKLHTAPILTNEKIFNYPELK